MRLKWKVYQGDSMTGKHTFTAIIQNAGGGGAFVEVPFDVDAAFGSKKPKVKVLIDGVPYRGTLVRMGTECHLLLILKSIARQIGKTFGEPVKIIVEPDTEPRRSPRRIEEGFQNREGSQSHFDKLSYTHQREYVQWINEAKRDETRQVPAQDH